LGRGLKTSHVALEEELKKNQEGTEGVLHKGGREGDPGSPLTNWKESGDILLGGKKGQKLA